MQGVNPLDLARIGWRDSAEGPSSVPRALAPLAPALPLGLAPCGSVGHPRSSREDLSPHQHRILEVPAARLASIEIRKPDRPAKS